MQKQDQCYEAYARMIFASLLGFTPTLQLKPQSVAGLSSNPTYRGSIGLDRDQKGAQHVSAFLLEGTLAGVALPGILQSSPKVGAELEGQKPWSARSA